jgi:hypothetical protein
MTVPFLVFGGLGTLWWFLLSWGAVLVYDRFKKLRKPGGLPQAVRPDVKAMSTVSISWSGVFAGRVISLRVSPTLSSGRMLRKGLLNLDSAFGQWWNPHPSGTYKQSLLPLFPLFALGSRSHYKKGLVGKTLSRRVLTSNGKSFVGGNFFGGVVLKR